MKNLSFFFLISIFIYQSCQENSNNHLGNENLNSEIENLFNQYYENKLKLYPIGATRAGDNRYNDLLLNDITKFYRASLKVFNQHIKINCCNITEENYLKKIRLIMIF